MVYDWIVVGGGIQGSTTAAFLVKNSKVSTDKLRIIDPHEMPLFKWTKSTERIGMKFLRSPFVHHLDVDPFSLRSYAAKHQWKKSEFYGVYKRPSLEVFNEHSQTLLHDLGLGASWHQGYVNGLDREDNFWIVSTAGGERLKSKNVVLALSINDQLHVPEWADSIKQKWHGMFHIFDDSADFSKLRMPVAVIGGGITAAHTVIKLSALYSGQVTLIKRHPFKVCDFDSDPGWLGPKYQKSYQRITDYSERREVIKKARNRGSLPSELFLKLRKLENDQTIKVADGEVTSVKQVENKELILSVDTQEVKVQSIVFATGFRPSRPGGSWLEKAIETFGLPCAKCGYPIVSQSLEWCRHLYVTGPLAELEIGPIARNISGARQAAERIVQSI
ncbi:lysine N(6)-hydroxylase/L-ornithine N(5)-oxygenase family protein [Cytobacillus firmus]|uniref:FAD/NAD(P)-binding protein n=1 Tax=Cytobacillus TaxID=2675230 RepID=UPI00203E9009|nr:FAD/NAD(P)-binding protein [Cytobacillus oceanisediminis]MCM3245879.1 lysine N(6)-hydroxylase/L-ornithine N(5)-oxygenase family protein [Cytobacillus oceanisediminis]MCS0825126.1 lysine N(6)-hydroxylase/L-ornithine N(5)-oxygenase family protein [Cytobacillus firmus]